MAEESAKEQKKPASPLAARLAQPENIFAIPPGMLNPTTQVETSGPVPDPRNISSTFTSLLKKQVRDSTQTKRKTSSNFYRAIVLSVEITETGTDIQAITPTVLGDLMSMGRLNVKDPLKIVTVTARIPELHQLRPIPADPNDVETIKLYPTFTTIDNISGNETYEVGDIVNVTFQDPENQKAGALLGPIIRAIPQNITNITCNATYVAAPGGQSLGTTPNATGHTGENAVSLRARDSRKSVALIGGQGMASKFGDMIQEYFFSQGYSLLGPGGYSPVDLKEPTSKNFRTLQLGKTLPDQVMGSEGPALKEMFTQFGKPDVVVFQFDNALQQASATFQRTSEKIDNLDKTASLLKTMTGAQKIFFIGAVEFIAPEKDAIVSSGANPNDWMGNASVRERLEVSMVLGGGTSIVIDPLKGISSTKLDGGFSQPTQSTLATKAIDTYISKGVIDVKGPPPPEPEKSNPVQPEGHAALQGLLPEIKSGEEGRDYILQVASRLGYNTSNTPPTDGSLHWKSLLTRNYSTTPLTKTELGTLAGFGPPPIAMSSEATENTTSSPPNAVPAASTDFPDEQTTSLLIQQLGERLDLAATAVKKQEAASSAASTAASATAATMPSPAMGLAAGCGSAVGFGAAMAGAPVPPGSTYAGPKVLPRTPLSKAVNQRPGNVKSILTIHKASVYKGSDPGWQSALSSMDAVSIKVLDGSRYFKGGGNHEFVKYVQGLGIPVHGWGFHYCRDIVEATKEAKAAAAICKKMGLKAYWWNAEKNWFGSSSVPPVMDPSGAGMQFMHVFKKNAPGIPVIGNCWSWEKVPGRPHVPGLMPFLIAAMDAFAPMIYATTPKTVVKKWVTRGKRSAAQGTPFCPMIGTGRIQTKNDSGQPIAKHNVWGWANDEAGHQGVLSLSKGEVKPTWVAYYYGNGTGPMASVGNMYNPPLSKLAQALRAGRSTPMPVGTGGPPTVASVGPPAPGSNTSGGKDWFTPA